MNGDPLDQPHEYEFEVSFKGSGRETLRSTEPPIVEVRDANGKLLRRIKATSIELHTSEDGTLMSVEIQGEELSLDDDPKEAGAQ